MAGQAQPRRRKGKLEMGILDNPLVKQGMEAQFAARRARIAAGEKPLGWEIGPGAPANLKKLNIEAPMIGFLRQKAVLPSGSTVSLKNYLRPVAEPEIAVRMATDLGPDATPDAVMAAIKELTPAIELADLDPVPEAANLDVVLAGDIYQRQVLLGTQTQPGGSVRGLTSRVLRRGVEVNRTSDPEALTGKLIEIVAHVATIVAAFGAKLSAGEIIITGSITPPPMIEPDETDFVHAV